MNISLKLCYKFSIPISMLIENGEKKIDDISDEDMEYLIDNKEIKDSRIFCKIMMLIDKYDINTIIRFDTSIKVSYELYHFIINNKKLTEIIKPIIIINPKINFDTIKIAEIQGQILSEKNSSRIPEFYFQKIIKKFKKNFRGCNCEKKCNCMEKYKKLFPTIIKKHIIKTNNLSFRYINNVNVNDMYSYYYHYYNDIGECYYISCIYNNCDILLSNEVYVNGHNGNIERYYHLDVKKYTDFKETNFYQSTRLCVI